VLCDGVQPGGIPKQTWVQSNIVLCPWVGDKLKSTTEINTRLLPLSADKISYNFVKSKKEANPLSQYSRFLLLNRWRWLIHVQLHVYKQRTAISNDAEDDGCARSRAGLAPEGRSRAVTETGSNLHAPTTRRVALWPIPPRPPLPILRCGKRMNKVQ
jgi:hypothetical protein